MKWWTGGSSLLPKLTGRRPVQRPAGGLLVWACLAVNACAPTPAPAPPPKDTTTVVMTPPPRTGADASRPSPCAQACTVLQKAACEEGRPTKDGETCTEFCTRIQARLQDLRAGCVSEAKDLPGIRACGVRCAQGVPSWAPPL